MLVGQEVLELRELRVVRDPRLVPFFLQVREVPLALLIPPTRIFGVLYEMHQQSTAEQLSKVAQSKLP